MAYTQPKITDNNKSPLIEVLTLMFLVINVLSCLVRSGTKYYMIKKLKTDDILVVVATLFSVGQSIAVLIGCGYGLGKHFNELSKTKQDGFYKSQYTANALFIICLLCAKLSGALSLRSMAQRNQKWIILVCEVVVGAWGFTALIVNFFQCQPPSTWDARDDSKCINRMAFWTYYSIANIATDVAIVAIMINNVRKIQTSWSKKFLVMGVFGSRILVTPAIAVQIYFSNKAFASSDESFSSWEAAITIQLVQCLVLFTVCVPNLKPFLDSLETGQIRIDDLRRQGKSSSNGYPSNRAGYGAYKSPQNSALRSKSRNMRSNAAVSDSTTRSQGSHVHEMVDLPKSKDRVTRKENGGSWDGQSHTSQSSQTILIHQTWQVDVDSPAHTPRLQ